MPEFPLDAEAPASKAVMWREHDRRTIVIGETVGMTSIGGPHHHLNPGAASLTGEADDQPVRIPGTLRFPLHAKKSCGDHRGLRRRSPLRVALCGETTIIL